MRICWDNLKKIKYRYDLKCWQNKKYITVFYTENICDVCGSSFLKQKRTVLSNGNFCDRKCYNKDKTIHKEKYGKRKIKKKCVICNEDNKNNFYMSDKSYCKKCRQKINEKYIEKTGKKYNYKKTKEQRREIYKKRRIQYCMSARIRQSLKNGKRGEKWHVIVGYDIKKLKKHLESQFDKGMNWDNYGEWEIDHIKPIASFNIRSYEDKDFKKCWSLENLRPLWKSENRSRGAIYGNKIRRLKK